MEENKANNNEMENNTTKSKVSKVIKTIKIIVYGALAIIIACIFIPNIINGRIKNLDDLIEVGTQSDKTEARSITIYPDNSKQQNSDSNNISDSKKSESDNSVNNDVDFTGSWYDSYSQRCGMEIICQNDNCYQIIIDWGSSASDNVHWEFYGEYDSKLGGIAYKDGCCYEQHYSSNGGNKEQTEVYNDGEGFIYIKDEKLYWEDKTENAGEDCVFVRENVTGSKTDEVDMEWYRSNDYFYNNESGSFLEVVYYDDGSLDFSIDGVSAISYLGEDSFVEDGVIYYNCIDGIQVQYFADTTPYIRIVGSMEYNGFYYLR